MRVRALGSSYRRSTPFPIYMVRVLTKVLRMMRWLRGGDYDIADAWLYHAYALTAVLKPFVGIPILISGRRSLSDYKEQFGPFERGLDKVARWSSDAFVANSYIVREDVATREESIRRASRSSAMASCCPTPCRSRTDRRGERAGAATTSTSSWAASRASSRARASSC